MNDAATSDTCFGPASGWLDALCARGETAVLVTVARVDGSGPRAPGAAMVVYADGQGDTIGGGHLELRACAIARAMLAAGRPDSARLQRFALGPTLGQCCGGVTYLCFEWIDAAAHAQLAHLRARLQAGHDSWRLIALEQHAPARLLAPEQMQEQAGAPQCHIVQQDGARWLAVPAFAERRRLVLFGAGHVGAALVRALAPLPCQVTWVDERAELFPPACPPNVRIEVSECPQQVAEQAPAGTLFLVMTHSHVLDQQLAEAILRRPELSWFGLIGSKTKRMLFEHRLAARGIAPARLAQMTCPIGVPGIDGKEPAVIAASVCAQLLQVWQAAQHATQQQTNPAATRPMTDYAIQMENA